MPGSGTFAFANFCESLPTSGNLCKLFANFYKLSATLVVLTYTGTGLELWATFAFGNCIIFYLLMKSGANVHFLNFLRYVPIYVLFSGWSLYCNGICDGSMMVSMNCF